MPKAKTVKRVEIGHWWELEAANGGRVEDYSACPPPIGNGAPQRFTEADFLPFMNFRGELVAMPEIQYVQEKYQKHGPFKVIKVKRYRLLKAKK